MNPWDGANAGGADSTTRCMDKGGGGSAASPSCLTLTRALLAHFVASASPRARNSWPSSTFASLSEFKRPHGQGQRRVGKTAERILQFAQAMETQQEKILVRSCDPAFPELRHV